VSDLVTVAIKARAAWNLRSIREFIAKDSVEASHVVLDELITKIGSLDHLPHRHKIVQVSDDPIKAVHCLPVPPYLIYYQVDEGKTLVRILTVRHSKQKPLKTIQ
jgi:plasmid stabilization system protein ParE